MRQRFHEMNRQIQPDPNLVQKTARRLQTEKSRKRIIILPRVALAASCGLLVAAACLLPGNQALVLCPLTQSPTSSASQPLPQSQQPKRSINTTLPAGQHVETVELSDGILYFTSFSSTADRAKVHLDPSSTYDEVWDEVQMQAYLGRDFRPSAVPQDLRTEEDDLWKVTFYNDGTPAWVTFWAEYRENFSSEYQPLMRSLVVEAAKDTPPFQCGLYDTTPATVSQIGNVTVEVGYCEMSYGPYDPDTHAPSGYYPVYVASFSVNGIGYYLRGENLTQQEFIETLLSLVP